MSFAPRAGVGGTATFNGNELPVVSWSVAPLATIQTFKNSKSGSHPQRLATFTDGGRFQISVDWDDSNNPFSAPYSFRVGQTITNVKLPIDGPTGSKFWSYPSAVIEGTPQSISVDGKILTSITCLADGAFGSPGQAAS